MHECQSLAFVEKDHLQFLHVLASEAFWACHTATGPLAISTPPVVGSVWVHFNPSGYENPNSILSVISYIHV